MTKDVKISIPIEIENGQKVTAEFVVQSDHFGEMTGEAVLESYDEQIRKEEPKGLKVLGRETRVVEMKNDQRIHDWARSQSPTPASNGSRGGFRKKSLKSLF